MPEFGFADTKGEWIIEGYGVDPDIAVENDPNAVIAGRTRSSSGPWPS